eukprot:5024342-Pyramimonas_sp.AAC.1
MDTLNGGSWSPQQALALIGIWSYAVGDAANVVVPICIDDGSYRATGPDHGRQVSLATQASFQLDEDADAQTNKPKTKFFAMSTTTERELMMSMASVMPESDIKLARHFVLVGGELCTH